MTTNEKIEHRARELWLIGGLESGFKYNQEQETVNYNWFIDIARHVLAIEIQAEINGLCLGIQTGSVKHFALKRRIELEKQLAEIRQ